MKMGKPNMQIGIMHRFERATRLIRFYHTSGAHCLVCSARVTTWTGMLENNRKLFQKLKYRRQGWGVWNVPPGTGYNLQII